MKFGKFYSETFGWVMEQVNKTTARKLFAQGVTVYVHPCNMRFDNAWQLPCALCKSDIMEDFDKAVNSYIYYNCDNERGKYPCFFVRNK